MEEGRDWKQKNLISELTRSKEMATQLRNLLQPYSASEAATFFVEKILSSLEKALSMIGRGASMAETNFVDEESNHPEFCKKRKRPHWNEQVKVSAGAGLEGSLDGHSWRKYGQKEILGSTYPRGYYRCTHRHSQGCLATKQVQRSNEDPKIFLITYRGRHTCSQTTPFPTEHAEEEKPEIPQHSCFDAASAGEALQIKTEDSDCRNDRLFPSLAFSSPSLGSETVEENLFSVSLMPAKSDFHHFNPNSVLLDYDLHMSDVYFSDTILAPNSLRNSPMGEFEFPQGKVDTGFPFHNLDFLS